MTKKKVHYKLGTLKAFGRWIKMPPMCGIPRAGAKTTEDRAQVTCKRCLKEMGK